MVAQRAVIGLEDGAEDVGLVRRSGGVGGHPGAERGRDAEFGHVAPHQHQLLVGNQKPRRLMHKSRGLAHQARLPLPSPEHRHETAAKDNLSKSLATASAPGSLTPSSFDALM